MEVSNVKKMQLFSLHLANAEQDIAFDQAMLGILYQSESFISPNKVDACMWLNISASNYLKGSTEDRDFAKRLRDILVEGITPEELVQSKISAQKWADKRPQGDRYFLANLKP